MQTNCLINSGSEKAILFFNGWGMDDAIVNHLDHSDFDIYTFSQYDDDFIIESSEFENYSEIHLVAWSMGVWAAAEILQDSNIKISKAIAINGTLEPINNQLGIPESIFKGTINNFSNRNKKKFDRRMLGTKDNFSKYLELIIDRSSESQLIELKRIYKNAINTTIDFTFDKIFIGNQDLIFPSKNQSDFWKGKAEIKEIECPHFPFFYFKSWADIING